MTLSPEELAALASDVSIWIVQDYIELSLLCFYLYYYLTTLHEEVSAIWPQKWRTGKILFLLIRYTPLVFTLQGAMYDLRTHATFPAEVCGFLGIFTYITSRVAIIASEVALLFCLHALLDARFRYVVLIAATYWVLTIGNIIALMPRYITYSKMIKVLLVPQLDRELGYACTWISSTSGTMTWDAISAFLSLIKAVCILALAIFIFFVRYRDQEGTLVAVIRRDGGFYIFTLTPIRLGAAISNALISKLGDFSIPNTVFT
ncbi:hypothetical protein DFP72DRAFT_508578 [Ephemerocybe angulata]|uniref:DUF6533 domain-containing protein n=1 Tax=Ephemerocybe angulata TaxID=980116 RepID=A0A8H6M3D3_9AGAR|nr:hypothetical protein DFP72DRAFT_508578 [Tulosesus angulatus]